MEGVDNNTFVRLYQLDKSIKFTIALPLMLHFFWNFPPTQDECCANSEKHQIPNDVTVANGEQI